MTTVTAAAPCRVDLAGGTLDLWPLGLLVPDACTVNVAIEILAGCSIETTHTGWSFLARDTDDRLDLDRLPERPDLELPPTFTLAVSAIAHFNLPPVRVETWSQASRGSGLGGSSALMVALVAASARVAGRDLAGETAIKLACDLETRVLGLPGGIQDHVAAWFGGVSLLDHGAGGLERESIEGVGDELGRWMVVADSRVDHHSGMNNWTVFRRFLEGDEATREPLLAVGRASGEMRDALRSGARGDDLLGLVGEALDHEWSARRRLSDAVSSTEIEALVAAARSVGGHAKVCGAGGGGCVVAFPGKGADRDRLVEALGGAGARVLQTSVRHEGVQVEVA